LEYEIRAAASASLIFPDFEIVDGIVSRSIYFILKA